jgi:hypothetical protein
MATILEFRQLHPAGLRNDMLRKAPAEVVFFPGVRYERVDDTTQPANSTQPAQRRDRLEIED